MRTVQTEQQTKWTAEAYFAWSRPDDGNLYEVINGKLIQMASPTVVHQRIAGELYFLIKTFLVENRIGEVFISPIDVVLGEQTVIPDVVFVRNEIRQIVEYKRIVGTPSLIVEVLSLSTSRRDWTDKKEMYANAGVAEYWLVNPEKETIEMMILDGQTYKYLGEFERDDIVRSQVITDFEIVASTLFT